MEDLQRARIPIAQDVLPRCTLLVMSKDEKQQRELLERFQGEGLDCKCLLSSRWLKVLASEPGERGRRPPDVGTMASASSEAEKGQGGKEITWLLPDQIQRE